MTSLMVLLTGYGNCQILPVAGQDPYGISTILTGPELPHIKSIVAECNSKVLIVVLNKSVKCFSLSNNGSEFSVSPLIGSILTTSANSCVYTTDIDTVWITMSEVLPPGDYTVTIKNGTDNNTLVDENSNQIPAGESVVITILPPVPTSLDSLSPVFCAPEKIQLVFSDPISCGSIATDGSDFKISGPQVIGITKADVYCDNGFTQKIDIYFDSPLVKGGNYQVSLVKGNDGNTLVNECGTETPADATIAFNAKDTVSALFSYDIGWGCVYDTIALHYGPEAATEWQWKIDSAFTNTSIAPVIIEKDFGSKFIQHIVSNSSCSDTVTKVVNLDNIIKAGFQAPTEVCPKDHVVFKNLSTGNIISWNWDFGDGFSSSQEVPDAHLFPDTRTGKTYNVRLVVKNDLGCYDTTTAAITKKQSCYITVPNAFTPNGDGKNDFLYPLNAFQLPYLEFIVYNRDGQLVFETRDWNRKWDGTVNGRAQATGTYIWTLNYPDPVTGKNIFLRGTSTLIR
jgi:gliding motility-associated-like protein